MKKVIKINLAAVLALFMAFGLMSFNLATHKTLQNQWYAVSPTGTILFDQPIASPDAITGCEAEIVDEVCAIELQPGDELLYDNEASVPGNRSRTSYVETDFKPWLFK